MLVHPVTISKMLPTHQRREKVTPTQNMREKRVAWSDTNRSFLLLRHCSHSTRDFTTGQPTNQITNQPIRLPTHQLIDQKANPPTHPPSNQLNHKPINPLTNQTTHPLTNQPIGQLTNPSTQPFTSQPVSMQLAETVQVVSSDMWVTRNTCHITRLTSKCSHCVLLVKAPRTISFFDP